MRRYRTLAATATLALALGGLALAAPAAQAAPTASGSLVHEDGELWYKAAAGQKNNLTVSEQIVSRGEFESYYVLTFRDRGDITIDPEAANWDECAYPTASDHTVARCAVEIPQNSDDSDDFDVDLGDGDDTAKIDPDGSAYGGIHGGAGDDVLQGNAADVFYGEGGNDKIDGGGGVMGFGAYGGDGDDTITNCAQECHGGAGNDTITGGDEDNVLRGDAGNDILRGGKGTDEIYGGQGDDQLYGEEGDDTLFGNSGDDVLWGGQGNDTLSGGPGSNEVHQD
ncbi:calcium-binding protein [Streptomyces rugosispiralis]|uniref:Calcium-binding protein n=1 Tax=Streptomyces rugosispiralis TaxID=2967341 RepID=A0ABT1V3J6_9ACTN|nr:calcium-binding protein [Streptomyces rugosispiralis]MCQ8191950.1 calcium-binding protein [Streptomyces rugosispiralis]